MRGGICLYLLSCKAWGNRGWVWEQISLRTINKMTRLKRAGKSPARFNLAAWQNAEHGSRCRSERAIFTAPIILLRALLARIAHMLWKSRCIWLVPGLSKNLVPDSRTLYERASNWAHASYRREHVYGLLSSSFCPAKVELHRLPGVDSNHWSRD